MAARPINDWRLTVAEKRQVFVWVAGQREKRRRKRELSGDSPEKAKEPRRSSAPNTTDAMARTATTGFLTGV